MTTLKRAIIKSYNAATHRVTVQIAGSLSVWLGEIPVSHALPPAAVIAGREGAVLLFTDDNPDDGVLVTVHGGAAPTGVAAGSRIQDADNDTWVDVENAADEDKVRVTVAGTLRALFQTVAPHHDFTGVTRIGSQLGVQVTPTDQRVLLSENGRRSARRA